MSKLLIIKTGSPVAGTARRPGISHPITIYHINERVSRKTLTDEKTLLSCVDRQIARQAEDFENEGGFTERLYRVRTFRRNNEYRKK